MKTKVTILLLAILPLLTFCISSCSDDDTQEKEELLSTLDETAGTVSYNDDISRWFISVHVEGTIDSANDYYPVSLDSEFRQPGLNVTFSGKVYRMPDTMQQGIVAPAGTKNYVIEITTIKKTQR